MSILLREPPEHIYHTIQKQNLDAKPNLEHCGNSSSQEPGHSHIYRNAYNPKHLFSTPYPGIDTLYDTFELSAAVNADKPCLGSRIKIVTVLLEHTRFKHTMKYVKDVTILDQVFSTCWKTIRTRLTAILIKIEL